MNIQLEPQKSELRKEFLSLAMRFKKTFRLYVSRKEPTQFTEERNSLNIFCQLLFNVFLVMMSD